MRRSWKTTESESVGGTVDKNGAMKLGKIKESFMLPVRRPPAVVMMTFSMNLP